MGGVGDHVEDGVDLWGVVWENLEEEGEEGEVAFVADVVGVVCRKGRGVSLGEGGEEGGKVPSSSTFASQYMFSSSLQWRSTRVLVNKQ